MKKSFLSAVAIVLTMGLSAYAQDDYEDYAYEEGVAESAPEGYSEVSDDTEAELNADAATARGRIEEQKQANAAKSEESSQSSSGSSSAPVDKPLYIGGHFGLGLSGVYGSEETVIANASGFPKDYADPFTGYIGVNMDIGGAVLYRINNLIGVTAELNLHIVDYFKESEVWKIEVEGDYGYHDEPLDENLIMVGVSIPVAARVYPTSSFYAELGAQVNLNLIGKFSLDNTEYDYSEDMGSWDIEPIGFAGLIGGGVVLASGGNILEFGGRIIVDLTPFEKADTVIQNANNGDFRLSVPAKGWHVQFVCNFFI